MSYSVKNISNPGFASIVSGDGRKILNVTYSTVYLSIDQGDTWSALANLNFSDRNTNIYKSKLYANTAFTKFVIVAQVLSSAWNMLYHCYASDNGGVSWYNSIVANYRAVALAGNNDTFYFSNGRSLYKSVDWGRSAQTVVSYLPSSTFSLACNSDGSIIYAGMNHQIQSSTNEGVTWNMKFNNLPGDVPYNINCNDDGTIVSTGLWRYTEDGFFWLSRDSGNNWSRVNGQPGNWICTACSRDGTIIIGTSDSNPSLLLISMDRGNSFSSFTGITVRSIWDIWVSDNAEIITLSSSYRVTNILNFSGTAPTPTISIDGQVIAVNGTYAAKARTRAVNLVVNPVEYSTVSSITGNTNLNEDLNTINIVIKYFGSYTTFTIYVMVLRNCFLEGTKILCQVDNEEKYIPVQEMKEGTLVKTSLNGYVPVHTIGHSKIHNPTHNLRGENRLYKRTKDTYPEIIEDLIVTGCHSVLVEGDRITPEIRKKTKELFRDDVWVTDNKLRLLTCLDELAAPYEEEGVFTIWHFALDHFDIYMNYGVWANGLLMETCSINMMREYSGLELV